MSPGHLAKVTALPLLKGLLLLHSNVNMEIFLPKHSDILKADLFLRGENFNFEILRTKKCKNITKSHLICVKHEEKTVKEVKMHKFLVCSYKSQDFAQSRKILRGRPTVRLCLLETLITLYSSQHSAPLYRVFIKYTPPPFTPPPTNKGQQKLPFFLNPRRQRIS